MLGTIEEERKSRISFLQKPNDSIISEFTDIVLHHKNIEHNSHLQDAWDFALSLDYHHPGQSKEVYLAHPMRVAMLYSQEVYPVDDVGLITAMLHNAKEVTSISNDELSARVGKDISNAISVLTVDRARQWDRAYKEHYYKNISESPQFVHKVKILDKLDNLFLLCLNKTDEIREMYLKEIDMWVIPMAQKVLPELVSYMRELVSDNRRIGFRPLQ